RLNPAAFQQCFSAWLELLMGDDEVRLLNIDGKTSRRSHDRKNKLGPLHLVSVWASERGLTLGQVATAEKSNEITAIPLLLDLVPLEPGHDIPRRREPSAGSPPGGEPGMVASLRTRPAQAAPRRQDELSHEMAEGSRHTGRKRKPSPYCSTP